MYSINTNYVTYLLHFSIFWLSKRCILNMSNINLVINNWIIHIGTSWEWGHPQNSIAFSNVSRDENDPSVWDMYSIYANYITYLQNISSFWLIDTGTSWELGRPQNNIWRFQKLSHLAYVISIDINYYIIYLEYFYRFWLSETCILIMWNTHLVINNN